MNVKVRVPGTTANMGPGFDTFGMALKLYNEAEFEEVSKKEFNKELEDNLIYKSFKYALGEYKYSIPTVDIKVTKCDIPMSRGLGSSAACIVLGIKAADAFMGNKLSSQDIINLGTVIEGHPDNIAPAVIGGMVISMKEDGEIICSKVRSLNGLKFAVLTPSYEVSTEKARKVLPDTYSRNDCIHNISRAAMLINALNNSDYTMLNKCFNDKIHEPFRKQFIPQMENIFLKAKDLGSLGEFISGSGSTLISIIEENNIKYEESMRKFLSDIDGGWSIKVIEEDCKGVIIL